MSMLRPLLPLTQRHLNQLLLTQWLNGRTFRRSLRQTQQRLVFHDHRKCRSHVLTRSLTLSTTDLQPTFPVLLQRDLGGRRGLLRHAMT